MTREEWKQAAIFLKTVYPRDGFLPDVAAMNIWYEMLEDLDGALVKESITRYAKSSPYPPTIADIRKNCEEKILRDARYKSEMRDIFDFAKGVYPSSKVEKDTMEYWNKLTADKNWSMRVEKARSLSSEIATYVRDAEINGQINYIPSFTEYLRYLADVLHK